MQAMAAMEEFIKKLKITIGVQSELNHELFEKIKQYSSLQEILNLVDKGADVNAQADDWLKNTPLIWAVRKRLSEVCLKLIDKGADVNAQNKKGDTPLILAGNKGLSEVCLKLIDKGADVNAQNKDGYTPLDSAASSGLSEVCLMLIDKGSDVNVKDAYGSTALNSAASSRLSEVCLKLIDKGTDVNAQAEIWGAALIHAARASLSEVCLKLIDNGADVNANNERSDTPLIWAAWRGLSDVCFKLIDKGADVNARNKDGYTPLIWAARKGLKDVCRAILVHSAIMPKTVDKIDESKQKLLTALCVFKRLKLPKDIRDLILNRDELKDEYLPELIHLIQKGNQLPEPYRKTVATKIAENTIAQLKPLMVEARKEAKSDEIKSILDKDLLEEYFGDQIHKNIMDNLEFLVRRAL